MLAKVESKEASNKASTDDCDAVAAEMSIADISGDTRSSGGHFSLCFQKAKTPTRSKKKKKKKKSTNLRQEAKRSVKKAEEKESSLGEETGEIHISSQTFHFFVCFDLARRPFSNF